MGNVGPAYTVENIGKTVFQVHIVRFKLSPVYVVFLAAPAGAAAAML